MVCTGSRVFLRRECGGGLRLLLYVLAVGVRGV